MHIAVCTDFDGWHEQQLLSAFVRLRAKVTMFSLRDCYFDASNTLCCGLNLPGFDRVLPDAVFVRHIPGGSFEQVTRRLSLLHALADCGVAVYNSARTIERTVDKAMTSFLLARHGIPTAPAWVCECAEQAAEIIREETLAGRQLILKPLFGSRGQGLKKLASPADWPAVTAQPYNGVFYLQRFIPPGGCDWRVFVIDGQAVAAMERRGSTWITNRAKGGVCMPAKPVGELANLAERATLSVGADYAGVDLIADEQGRILVLEINGLPAWQGLQEVSSILIARHLAEHLLHRAGAGQSPRAVG